MRTKSYVFVCCFSYNGLEEWPARYPISPQSAYNYANASALKIIDVVQLDDEKTNPL